MTFSKKYTRNTFIALLALGASYQSGFAAELDLVQATTATMGTLALANNASAAAYTDNTFATPFATSGVNANFAVIDADDISASTAMKYLSLTGVKLSLTGASPTAGSQYAGVNIISQLTGADALPAANTSYNGARFASVADLKTHLAKYLASANTVTAFGNIQIDGTNALDYVVTNPSDKANPTSVADISSGNVVTNFPVNNLAVTARKQFAMLTTGTSTLLRAENLDAAKTLTGDATIALAGFAFDFNSNAITGGGNGLTITSASGTPAVDLEASALAGSFSGVTVSGSAIVDNSFASFVNAGPLDADCPLVITGTAKFRCKVATTFGNVTLG